MQASTVTTADGLNLAVQEWGNPRGPEILLIHGFNQAHLSWLRQVQDSQLAAEFRMITFDLRGHGSSDKPLEKERYAHQNWGDDVAAIMRAIAAPTGAGRVVIRRQCHLRLRTQLRQ
jgi:non-heme chloroperoxidase